MYAFSRVDVMTDFLFTDGCLQGLRFKTVKTGRKYDGTNNDVARFCWRSGQIIRIAASNGNCELKKIAIFIEFPNILAQYLKIYLRRKSAFFVCEMYILPPLGLCCYGRSHHFSILGADCATG